MGNVLRALEKNKKTFGDTALHRLASSPTRIRLNDYFIAVIVAALALAVRTGLDRLVHNDQLFVLGLLGVVFVSWRSGFGPGAVTLVLSLLAMLLFMKPDFTTEAQQWGYLLGASSFVFCGFCCAGLGEAQRYARRRTKEALAVALERKAELEVEVARRGEAEFSLRQREAELHGANEKLARELVERERAADALRESEERFRSMADSVPVLIWVTDGTPTRNYFNKTWLEFTGQPLGRELGDGWIDSIHPDFRDQYLRRYTAAFRAHQSFEVEYLLRRHDGEYRWVLARGSPRFTPSGVFTGFCGLCMDITEKKHQAETLERMVRERTTALEEEVEERKRIEQRLRDVAEELARSNRDLEQFAYVASHDLQEPLRKIQAFGDRLRTKCRDMLPDEGKDYVERMHVSSARMRRLIDDLLTYSRVTTQTRPPVRINLSKLVREVIADLDEYIDRSGAVVEVEDLPTLDADPSQMRQLFQNLIANAIKFHRPDVPPNVRIYSDPSEGGCETFCHISIQDNGIGFDEKYRERIFQVFQRLHGRDEYEGSGIGLAICRKIVERHGGTIVARSRAGEGTTFILTLPLPYKDAPAHAGARHETDHHPDGGR